MSDFSDYVHICILDELNFKLIEKYNEPYYDKTGKYNGYTLRERDLDKTFFDNIPQEKFVQSQVGKGKNDLIDTNIRSSKIIKDINVRIKSVYELYTDKINIQKIKPLKDNLECKFTYHYDLIKYEEGDHFNEFHYDTFENDNVATLLIFPPKKMCGDFTGGDLVFKINEQEYRVEPSKFDITYGDKFVCVIFGRVLHKCESVLSGIRYVFKTNIEADLPNILSDVNKFKIDIIDKSFENNEFIIKQKEQNIIQLEIEEKNLKELLTKYYDIKMNLMIENLPDNLEEYLEENLDYDYTTKQEIKTLNQEYGKIKKNINRLRNMEYNDEPQYYKLNEKKYNICVLPYYIENMSNILEYTLSTRMYIKSKIQEGWNVTYMHKNFDYKTDYEEGYRKLENDDIYDDYGYNYSKYELHYDSYDISNGKCLDYHSEYNDQSGNDIYEEYKCSCLLIWK